MKKMLLLVLFATIVYGCGNPKPAEETPAAAPADTTPKPVEFADASYMDKGKAMFAAMTAGDMDKYMEVFADDAQYRWNSGDSLIGKPAINDFWRKRREALTTITFDEQIWLPVKVNQPQSIEAPGIWLLGWAKVSVNYVNKTSMTQWMHWTIHFNDNNQVDAMHQYVDMAPINAVMPIKK